MEENQEKDVIAKAMAEAGSVMNGENMEVKLSNGLIAVVRPLSGDDFDVATDQAKSMKSDDTNTFVKISMALATTIDGNPIVIEDLKTMSFKDRILLQGAFSELNF